MSETDPRERPHDAPPPIPAPTTRAEERPWLKDLSVLLTVSFELVGWSLAGFGIAHGVNRLLWSRPAPPGWAAGFIVLGFVLAILRVARYVKSR